MSAFTLTATDGPARSGVLRTAHGDIPTPAFMPVGTKATVKALHPDEVRDLGASVILANTYHLHFRPGADVVESLGGVHRFSGWDGPILTDSGGYQVFSLRDTILGLDEGGVTFRSVYDGSPATFSPESVAEIQRKLGVRHRDVPRRLSAPELAAGRVGACGLADDELGRAPG